MLSNNSEKQEVKENKSITTEKEQKGFSFEINLPSSKYLPKNVHLGYLFLSFAVAFLLWFAITDRELVEAQYTVDLEYAGLADDLFLLEGMEKSVQVRVKTTAKRHDSLKEDKLSFGVDLSDIKKGANVIELALDSLFSKRNYELIDVSPNKLVLVSDKITEKDVKLEAVLSSDVKNARRIVGELKVEPLQVRIKGPESEINKINKMTVSFTPDTDIAAGKYTESVAVVSPKHVETIPPLVSVSYEIKSGLVTVNYIVPVTIVNENKEATYQLSEEKVTLNVLMPDHLIRNEEFIKGLSAYVVPTGASSETAILRFKIPPTAKLKSSSIDKVEIKKLP